LTKEEKPPVQKNKSSNGPHGDENMLSTQRRQSDTDVDFESGSSLKGYQGLTLAC
jgi:hypothetical protein